MKKLYFRYGAMGSGKTANLISTAYNYKNKGMDVIIFNYYLDERFGKGVIASRNGISLPTRYFYDDSKLFDEIKKLIKNKTNIKSILFDESQFLKKEQIDDLTRVVNELNIPVICYGIKTDFKSNLFEGSKRLLELANDIEELKTVCWCGDKATMNVRIVDGKIVKTGNQIQIGSDESYDSVCLKHYFKNKLN